MSFPTLVDPLRQTITGAAVSGEEQTIESSSPYAIELNQIPRFLDSVSSLLDNRYDTLTEAARNISVTVESTSYTLTEDNPPGSEEVFVQASLGGIYQWSPVLIFPSGDAGKAAEVTYTGLGSAVMKSHIQAAYDEIDALESSLQKFLRFSTFGTPVSDDDLDTPQYVYQAGTISQICLDCADMGSDSTDLVVDVLVDGTTVFSSPSNRPEITNGSGTNQHDSVLAAAMSTTTLAVGDWVTVNVVSRPSDCQHVTVVIQYA